MLWAACDLLQFEFRLSLSEEEAGLPLLVSVQAAEAARQPFLLSETARLSKMLNFSIVVSG